MTLNTISTRNEIRPYVGITGVQELGQVPPLVAAADRCQIGDSFTHNLMLGCLVSPATRVGGAPTHTQKPWRHVTSVDALREILLSIHEQGAIGMLHMELHKPWPGTKTDGNEVIALYRALSINDFTPPIQLNGVILPEEIAEIHKEIGCPIVLQLRKELSELGEATVLRYIEAVSSHVKMILLDTSAGEGARINVSQAVSMHRMIESRFPHQFNFGYAGGLGGISELEKTGTTATIHEIKTLLGDSAFSVDTETRARALQPDGRTDYLDLPRCEAYLAAVAVGLYSE